MHRRPASPDVSDEALDRLAARAAEERARRRLLRFALAVAAAFHVLLFMVRLPAGAATVQDDTDEPVRIFPITPVRLVPPEVPRRRRRVSIPVPVAPPVPLEPIRDQVIDEVIPEIPTDAIAVDVPPPPLPEPTPEPITILVTEPEKLVFVQPSYPEIARRAGVSGTVILRIVIDPHGTVADVAVLRGAAMGLTAAAVDAVRQWRYRPTLVNGRPVAAQVVITVNFSLQR